MNFAPESRCHRLGWNRVEYRVRYLHVTVHGEFTDEYKMDHLRESLQIFYPTQNPHIWTATTENHYQASGMHRDHYFSYTPVPESTHLDCYAFIQGDEFIVVQLIKTAGPAGGRTLKKLRTQKEEFGSGASSSGPVHRACNSGSV